MPISSDTVLIVKDANVIIDLADAGLLQAWFSLGLRTTTTDFVESELKKGLQWEEVSVFIEQELLLVESFSPSDILSIVELGRKNGVGAADGSVLFLAERESGVLLTGDRKLRRKSEDIGIEVRGIFWIFDTLVEELVISPKRALSALKVIVTKGSRLPQQEAQKRMKLWGRESN